MASTSWWAWLPRQVACSRISGRAACTPARIAPGVLWIALLLSALLSLPRMLEADDEDGSLEAMALGPMAMELVVAAKAIKTFAKDNKALVIKGGYMDGRALSIAEVEAIADLETREVLLAKLAGAMKGNLAKAAGLFNQPASQVARLAAALPQKQDNAGAAEILSLIPI